MLFRSGAAGHLVTDTEKRKRMVTGREICEELMADNEVEDSVRIVAELIHIETYHCLDEYEKSAQLAKQFIAKWEPLIGSEVTPTATGTPYSTQVVCAKGWLMMALYELRDFEECIALCSQLVDGNAQTYKNFNVVAYAMLYKALCLEAAGQADLAADTRDQLASRFPKWYELTAAHKEARLRARKEARQRPPETGTAQKPE